MIRQNVNKHPSVFRNLDWVTIILYLIMVLAGAVSIYAASYDFDEASLFSFAEFSGKQIRWIGLALVIGLFLLLIESRIYDTYAYIVYAAIIILLIVTRFVAPDIKGSHSWIVLGPMSLQPAEFAKVATALAVAKLFSGYNFSLNAKFSNYLKACGIILLPVILILLQNETGSALVFLSLFFVLYREGMSGLVLFSALLAVVVFVITVKFADTQLMQMQTGQFAILVIVMLVMLGMIAMYARKRPEVTRNIAILFGASGLAIWILSDLCGVAIPGMPVLLSVIGVGCIYITIEALRSHLFKLLIPVAAAFFSIVFMFMVNIAFDQLLQPHQQQRIKVVLGIEEDLRGAGYNVNQSKIAIGSGGLAGKGFLGGTQTKLKYVPEQHTDFIFCTIGEEEGFLGTIGVELLFVFLILRCITIAERQPTVFGRVYAYCVASYLMFHFCINIGMVIGLCPVIGIPLPFFSYGGSSLWGFTLLIFIMLKIDASRKSYFR